MPKLTIEVDCPCHRKEEVPKHLYLRFVCQNCGAAHTRWQGKCDACGEWNTMAEESLDRSIIAMKNEITRLRMERDAANKTIQELKRTIDAHLQSK